MNVSKSPDTGQGPLSERTTKPPLIDKEMMLIAAAAYAELGWYIFPLHRITADGRCGCSVAGCTDMGKHPAIKWREGSTNDPVQVEKFWRRWPFAGIGLDTGKSGIYVVDVDVKSGGMETLAALDAEHGDWYSVLTARTGGGGLHFYYRNLKGVPLGNSTGSLGQGIDTRGNGGYVVLAPSAHKSGNRYEWATEFDLDTIGIIPQFMIRNQSPKMVHTSSGMVADGTRNVVYTSFAGKLRRAGCTEEEIDAVLEIRNRNQSENPHTFSENERKKIAHSMAQKPTGDEQMAINRAGQDAVLLALKRAGEIRRTGTAQ